MQKMPVQEVEPDNSKSTLLRENKELLFANETFDDDHVSKLNSKTILKDLQSSLLQISVPVRKFNEVKEKEIEDD